MYVPIYELGVSFGGLLAADFVGETDIWQSSKNVYIQCTLDLGVVQHSVPPTAMTCISCDVSIGSVYIANARVYIAE
jgi:hypothetical protein